MAGTSSADREQPGPALLGLIRQPYVAEILATLDERPHSLAGLRQATGAPRRLTVSVLHALAAHGAVAREPDGGSWDTLDEEPARYRLTPTGRALIGHLFHPDSWWAAYAMYPPFE